MHKSLSPPRKTTVGNSAVLGKNISDKYERRPRLYEITMMHRLLL